MAPYTYTQGCSSLMVVGFVATTLVLARLIAPSRRGQGQTGHLRDREMSVTDPWRPFPVRYYVFALLFLIFDVEAAFVSLGGYL